MSQTEPTLPEELLLLALDPQRGKPYCRNRFLQYGMAGAALAELELQGRVTGSRGRVQVTNPLTPPDPLLAQVLATLRAPDKRRFAGGVGTRSWIRRTGRQVEGLYLDHLVKYGVLRRETHRFLGLFPYHRHPAGPDSWAPHARSRFAAAEAAGFPDRRSRLLAGFAAATGLARTIAHGGRPSRAAMRVFVREEWAPQAVHRNVVQDKSNQAGGG
ncbi:GPP34 family phosphoprotein [Streptomyces sp. NPDC051322]|uniref:GOLPH3/VPS74 family protein n=1 Tax=Streptomyces sp. NPDC051322 TaxID=3154645 RepID=UPI003450E829